jgi:4-hydroxy-tetrahydrodipicolinate reductase
MIGIYAPNGKMGKTIIDMLEKKNLSYCCFDRKNIKDFLQKSEVIIDFSMPLGTKYLIEKSIEFGIYKPMVIGTTGLDEDTRHLFDVYIKEAPMVYAENFSLGIFVQKKLAEIAAQLLDFDIEIFEVHHHHKKDAPSGTTKSLVNALADVRQQKGEDVQTCYQEKGCAERKKGQIGVAVSRGGNVVGEHTVFFYGENEQIHITHRGYNRKIYAEGAITAANWIKDKAKNLYKINEILT